MKYLLGILMLSGALAQGAEKPNILFIAIDDMNDWTGFLGGHPQAQTPNMDKLARRGVSFTNAHCPAPGCSPCRNALLFGTEPFHSGLYAFYDHAGFSDNVLKGCATIPELLQASGYNTYGAGKIHHRREPTPKEWTEFHKPEPHQLVYKPEEGYQIGNSRKMAFCPTANPLEEHPDYKVASYGVEVLSRKHDKPFFLAVGIVKPHLAFVCPQQFFDLYPKDVKQSRTRYR